MTNERKELAARCREVAAAAPAPGRSEVAYNLAAIADLLDPPAHPDDVVVRIAVAEAADQSGVMSSALRPGEDGGYHWEWLENEGYPIRLGIVTARLRRPVVPVVEGETET